MRTNILIGLFLSAAIGGAVLAVVAKPGVSVDIADEGSKIILTTERVGLFSGSLTIEEVFELGGEVERLIEVKRLSYFANSVRVPPLSASFELVVDQKPLRFTVKPGDRQLPSLSSKTLVERAAERSLSILIFNQALRDKFIERCVLPGDRLYIKGRKIVTETNRFTGGGGMGQFGGSPRAELVADQVTWLSEPPAGAGRNLACKQRVQ